MSTRVNRPLRAGDDRVVTLYAAIGARIANARRARGWSQGDLGHAIHLGRSQIANIEAGRAHITLHHLLAAAHALGVHLTDLLAGPLPDLMQPASRPPLADLLHQLTRTRSALDECLSHITRVHEGDQP